MMLTPRSILLMQILYCTSSGFYYLLRQGATRDELQVKQRYLAVDICSEIDTRKQFESTRRDGKTRQIDS